METAKQPHWPAFILCAGAIVVFSLAASPLPVTSVRNFDLQHSTMTIYVYKQGIFAFAADNHEVDAPVVSGSFDEAKRSVELTVDATKMRVLDVKMPADRRATVQSNMLGPMVLDTGKYPTITFRSTKFDRVAKDRWAVAGDLTLHGQTHSIVVDLSGSDGHYTGSAMVRQTDFGITPIRIAGGTVKVKDDVKVVFDVSIPGLIRVDGSDTLRARPRPAIAHVRARRTCDP